MKKTRWRLCLEQAQLTQEQSADLFRVGHRTGRRWALGEARIPFAVSALMRLVLAGKVTIKEIKALED